MFQHYGGSLYFIIAMSTPFTRLTSPDPKFQPVISDLYDKVQTALNPPKASAPASTPPSTVATAETVISVGGASGQTSGPQYAFIPSLTALPSNNPTGGSPYAQDGLLIEVNSQFWRYNRPALAWQEAGTATAILTDTHANRVANYPPATYPNALFLESDTLLLLESDSTTWRTLAGTIKDTHANRLSMWPSIQFSTGTKLYETDRTITYQVAPAIGTVTVTGGLNVAWISGIKFDVTWPTLTVIAIAGNPCTIFSVNSATSITLALPTANASGVTYSVDNGIWQYFEGEMQQAYVNMPNDLGDNDVILDGGGNLIGGFLFYDNVNSLHIWQWTGIAGGWTWGPGNDAPSGQFGFFDADPGAGWHLADGSTATKYLKDGTSNPAFVLPNTLGGYVQAGSSYPGSKVAAHAPLLTMNSYTPAGTVTGSTDAAATGDNVTVGGGAAMAGTGATVVGSVTFDPAMHQHTLTAATFAGTPAVLTGTIDNTGTPVTFEMLSYYRL